MIERYTIKFGPAVSQKELEKALNEATDLGELKMLSKMKCRIEFIADIEDIKKLSQLLKSLSAKPAVSSD
jgi:UDP-N-acetylglucosamine enolpyruvyl transferase